MTVRIRQLIKAVGAGSVTPPIPPPPTPTMMFVVQPTTTEIGQPFDPIVMVQVSDGGSDSLTISGFSGACSISPMTVTANMGLAMFPGLLAGTAVGSGCRLLVHNNTRPVIEDIVSDPFDVFEVVPVEPAFLNSAAMVSADGQTAMISGFNATDANFFVIAIALVSDGFPNIVPTSSPANTWVMGPSRAQGAIGQTIAIFYAFNAASSGNMTFMWDGQTPGVAPWMIVGAFQGIPSTNPFQTGTSASSNDFISLLALPTITPATSPSLAVTAFMRGAVGTPAVITNAFQIMTPQIVSGGQGWYGAMAYRFQTGFAPVGPTWSLVGAQTFRGNAVLGMFAS